MKEITLNLKELINIGLIIIILYSFFKYGLKSTVVVIIICFVLMGLIVNPDMMDLLGTRILNIIKNLLGGS